MLGKESYIGEAEYEWDKGMQYPYGFIKDKPRKSRPTSPEQVREVRRLHSEGELSQTEIAERVGLIRSTVSGIVNGRYHTEVE